MAQKLLPDSKEQSMAAVNATDSWGQAPLVLAAGHGQTDMVKLLLINGAKINAQPGYNSSALQLASYSGRKQVVQLLLEAGANIDAQGGYYGTALQAAAVSGSKQVVELLIKAGANVNAQGGAFGNALHAALEGGHEDVVALLLLQDGVQDLRNPQRETAVSRAAFYGLQIVLKLLLDSPRVVCDHRDRYGRTLLWWAAAGGQTTVVETLLNQYNGDPNQSDYLGRTPFWIARKKGHHAVSEILQRFDRQGNMDIGCTMKESPPSNSDCSSEGIADMNALSTGDDRSRRSVMCDVCTVEVLGNTIHHHCRICADGDWDVCEDCRVSGALCPEGTHNLVKRTEKDGFWVELPD